MIPFRPLSTSEQLAQHLRGQIEDGTLSGAMPGVLHLVKTLGVNSVAVGKALKQLEQEGLVSYQGKRKSRRIVPPGEPARPTLHFEILLYQRSDRQLHYMVSILHELREMGYVATYSQKSLVELKMNPERIKRYVEGIEADAWIVCSGSQELLEWFAQGQKPAFALAGRRRRVKIAGWGPDKMTAQRDLVQRLIDLGHRRIVILARDERRRPRPAAFEQAFLDQLKLHDIPVGPFNLPDWDESLGGLQRCLDSLFACTPPTALFIEEMPLFVAAMQHLASAGIAVPRDVSMICDDPDPAFGLCLPPVSHIHWSARPLVRRIMKWVENVAQGNVDLRQSSTKAHFLEGGTIGPALVRH